MILLLFSLTALADPETDVTPLPPGTVVTIPSKPPFTVQGQGYLMPETLYDTALLKAKKLSIVEPAFDQCTDLSAKWVTITQSSLNACSVQFDKDGKTVLDLQQQVVTQETRASLAESKLQTARNQRNVAWAITGGLILGAIAVTSVAVGHL